MATVNMRVRRGASRTKSSRHLGRTRALLHLVSVESGSLDSIEEDYRRVDTELREHSDALFDGAFLFWIISLGAYDYGK